MAIRDVVVSAIVAAAVAAGTTLALSRTTLLRQAVEVPSVLGLPVQSARALIETPGLRFVVAEEREDAQTAAGNIAAQKPLGGSKIDRGQAVEVVVAKVPVLAKAPALVGQPFGEAKLRLEMAKLTVGKISEENSALVDAGRVISQSVAAGGEVRPGATIDLTLSKGAALFPVPSVVGRSLTRAKEELQKAGFLVGTTRTRADDDHSDGVILEQTPAANQAAAKGTAIDLVINRT
jgi:serine/threonine-protein kinase